MGLCISTHSSSSSASSASSSRTKRRRSKHNNKAISFGFGGGVDLHLLEEDQVPNGNRWVSNGCGSVQGSLYTQQGKKGTNQDAMILWENFASQTDSVFCGVFDGHGPYGHYVATNVRNSLPIKLLTSIINKDKDKDKDKDDVAIAIEEEHNDNNANANAMFPEVYVPLKRAITNACQLVDKELKLHPTIDCFCSGTTAVTVLKQGHDLIIANIGDSRAVLATRSDDDDNNLNAVQLTVDLKPNLPREAARIEKCRGRVFALADEPDVSRVWLPNNDSPGLAMARAFGDFCLKDYGLISVPDVSYHRLTDKDAFVILATDGIWDALSNKEAVHIVASAPSRTTAARALVDSAVRSWRFKYPSSKVDDCAVVCLFFDSDFHSDFASSQKQKLQEQNTAEEEEQSPSLARFDTLSGNCGEIEIVPVIEEEEEGLSCRPPENEKSQSTRTLAECILMPEPDEEEWSALEGITRVNSLLSLPRFLLRDKKSSSQKRKL